MTVINGSHLLMASPIKDMLPNKHVAHGTSYGLSEAGYDIRIKQDILFQPTQYLRPVVYRTEPEGVPEYHQGRFILSSAIEEFQMPTDLVGIVHDKSTWARKGLSVFNTVIEPGWNGFLTLELVYQGEEELFVPAGSGIAQVIFHHLTEHRGYNGKYQNQADEPVEARHG